MFRSVLRARHRLARAVGGLVAALLISASHQAIAWQTAHGKPDNTGSADVSTVPAVAPLPGAPQVGGIAPGAGPVIAPDGTVYVVNGRGKLMSFKPDGTPGWTRDIGNQGVLSSPALGSDGSIFVVGAVRIRDKTTNPPSTREIAELHKFSAGGAYLWHVPLPGAAGGLTTSAPPNIMRVGGTELVLVPTVRLFGGFETRLTGFAAESGGVLADTIVSGFVPETTGGVGGGAAYVIGLYLTFGHGFGTFDSPSPSGQGPEDVLPDNMRIPFPAVAVFTPAGSSESLVMMSDGFQDLVGYTFSGGGFVERFRVHDDKRYFTTPPLAWPDGHAMISTGAHATPTEALFAGWNMSTITAAGPATLATPAALGRSRFALVERNGGVTILRGAAIENSVDVPGQSIASPAASREHIFVSTASAFYTYDKETLREVAKFSWRNGGASPVAIGPQGHVYAIADGKLYVFPPVKTISANELPTQPQQPGKPAQTEKPAQPEQPASTDSQSYNPPLTDSNNRLLACQEPDGEDCGKKDYKAVALAFCQAQGFAAAAKFDVDTRKGQAETLDGRLCSKKKCKVFDELVCRN
jgi:hypothetical protein